MMLPEKQMQLSNNMATVESPTSVHSLNDGNNTVTVHPVTSTYINYGFCRLTALLTGIYEYTDSIISSIMLST